MKIVKVAVFDDNPVRRDGLQVLLNAMEDMTCVGLFEDCRDVVQKVEAANPDVVLMDINMPHVDGIEGLTQLRKAFPGLKIIMQTIFEDESKILSAICAGADGYILKQTPPMQLLEGIVEVMNGGAPLTPTVAKKVLSLFNDKKTKVATPTNFLTKREQEILKLLVEGYSYKMIAEECFITYATVNTHIVNIYEKLQVNSATGAVSKAIKEGLV